MAKLRINIDWEEKQGCDTCGKEIKKNGAFIVEKTIGGEGDVYFELCCNHDCFMNNSFRNSQFRGPW